MFWHAIMILSANANSAMIEALVPKLRVSLRACVITTTIPKALHMQALHAKHDRYNTILCSP